MVFHKEMLTSNRQDYETPQTFFDRLNKVFNFDLDAASSENNHKVANYFTEENSAFNHDWSRYKRIFINPPYVSKVQDKFVEKAISETNNDSEKIVCMLVPVRSETLRWFNLVYNNSLICFVKGRFSFEINGKSQGRSPFGSCLLIFGKNKEKYCQKIKAEFSDQIVVMKKIY